MSQNLFLLLILSILFFACKGCTSDPINDMNQEQLDASTTPLSCDDVLDIPEIIAECNNSFIISQDYLSDFNATGRFPDETDKTPMCYIRCYYEKLGIIINGMAIKSRIQELLWPATGDSVEVCQKEGQGETNPCVAAYNIARCLMLRSLVDARNGDVSSKQ